MRCARLRLLLSASANHIYTVGSVAAASYVSKKLVDKTDGSKKMGGWDVSELAVYASFALGLWAVAAFHAGVVSVATLMSAGQFFAEGFGMTVGPPDEKQVPGGPDRSSLSYGKK